MRELCHKQSNMRIFTFFFLLLLTTISVAQPLPYQLTNLNEDYVPFDDGISLFEGFEWDDDYFTAPIGFSFTYMDSTYESISAIGIFGGLGSELVLGEYNDFGKYDILCPALIDLVDAPGSEESVISYITTGTPGSRIFKLQWSNCSVYGDKGPTNARVNMQVWLYEATNSIDFRYGPTSNFDIQDYLFLNGLPLFLGKDCFVAGDSSLPTNLWALDGTSANEGVQSYQSLNEFYTGVFLEDYPADGRVYHFEGVPDGVDQLEIPALVVYPTLSEELITLAGYSTGSYMNIYDATGHLIYQDKLMSSNYALHIANWTSGLYIVEVNSGITVTTSKFIRK